MGDEFSTHGIVEVISTVIRQCLYPSWYNQLSMTDVKDELVKSKHSTQRNLGTSSQVQTLFTYPGPSSNLPFSESNFQENHKSTSEPKALSLRSLSERRNTFTSLYTSPDSPTSWTRTTPYPTSTGYLSSMASTSNEEASLAEAISNIKPVIYLDEHGLPRSATLQGLINHLIREFDTGADTVYREIFFTGCSDFTTSEDMFSAFNLRFEEAEKDRTYRLQCPRKSILMIIGYWLEQRNYHISVDVLGKMKQMGMMACSRRHCAEENSVAQMIIRHVEDRLTRETQNSVARILPGGKLLRTSDITPRDLAIALTLLEGDNYRFILPADYISHLMEKPTPNNIKAAYLTNNKIVLWVKQSVLHYDTIESRAQVFKFFINVAIECQILRNFASLTAVVNALNSASIDRLRLTKKELPLSLKENLHELDQLLDPEGNHRAYRKELRDTEITSRRHIGIPWIAVHLRELYSTLQKNPQTLRIDGISVINFRRYVKFTERIQQVLHFTPPDLGHHRHKGHLAYITHQLRNVHLDAQNDDDLMERSLALEAGESRDYRARKRELKRLGFRA